MTNTYVNYADINSLGEFAMIAGTQYTLTFNVFQEDGVTPQNIGGATIKWYLSPYGRYYAVSELDCVATGDNSFEVVIPASETENLSGKYLHQISIKSFSQEEDYRPAQGVILITPQIKTI